MAYAIHEITALGQIPALIGAFADSQGWTATYAGNECVIQNPGNPSAMRFKLAAVAGAAVDTITLNDLDGIMNAVTLTNPRYNRTGGTGSVSVRVEPTKLHLIGRGSAGGKTPFIVAAIEFGYNDYRHIYIGNIDRTVNFQGGELVYITQQAAVVGSQANTHWLNKNLSHSLFAIRHYGSHPEGGGFRLIRAGDPSAVWRRFSVFGSIPSSSGNMNDYSSTGRNISAMGGVTDSITTLPLASVSRFATAQVLMAAPIFIFRDVGGQTRFMHVGYPAGVRFMRIDGIENNAQFTVGNRPFFSTPMFSRQSSGDTGWLGTTSTTPSAHRFPYRPSSGNMGYAFETD